MKSSEFRRVYASLTEPTEVTVNGHVVGEWIPVGHPRYLTAQEAKAKLAEVRRDVAAFAAEHPFSTRPFTPVPKGR
jgi:hypothetical protein